MGVIEVLHKMPNCHSLQIALRFEIYAQLLFDLFKLFGEFHFCILYVINP